MIPQILTQGMEDAGLHTLEIRCHYGNQVLEIAESWIQDGKLVISVYAVPTEDLKDKTNQT